MLIVGRVICGLCVGVASSVVPTYITEVAPPTKRGRLVGAQQWAVTIGILIMFFVSYGASFMGGTGPFRLPWGLQAVPAILLFFGMMVLPESPRWLASNDRWEDCHDVLVLTHGNGDADSPWVQREYDEIKQWCQIEAEAKQVSYLELFHPKMINRTHIALFTQIWSQLTGMNVMSESALDIHQNTKSAISYGMLTRHINSVLHFLRLHDERIDRQCLAHLVIDRICHQRRHDGSRTHLPRSCRAQTSPPYRRRINGNLAICQRWNPCRVRHQSGPGRRGRRQGSLGPRLRLGRKGSHRMLLPVRGLVRTNLGPSLVDIPTRAVPKPCPRQSRGARDFGQLGLQLCTRLFCPAGLYHHPLAGLHCLWRLLRGNVPARLLPVPGNRRQAPRRGDGHV